MALEYGKVDSSLYLAVPRSIIKGLSKCFFLFSHNMTIYFNYDSFNPLVKARDKELLFYVLFEVMIRVCIWILLRLLNRASWIFLCLFIILLCTFDTIFHRFCPHILFCFTCSAKFKRVSSAMQQPWKMQRSY